jgi:pre-rRNA-processing protein TSR3
LGYEDLGLKLLDKFKWGHTFLDLNKNLLEDYSKLESEDEISPLLKEYKIPF